jgi:hypothetical protein
MKHVFPKLVKPTRPGTKVNDVVEDIFCEFVLSFFFRFVFSDFVASAVGASDASDASETSETLAEVEESKLPLLFTLLVALIIWNEGEDTLLLSAAVPTATADSLVVVDDKEAVEIFLLCLFTFHRLGDLFRGLVRSLTLLVERGAGGTVLPETRDRCILYNWINQSLKQVKRLFLNFLSL